MGIFRSDEEEKKIYKKLAASANYQFCNVYLPNIFFLKSELFAKALTNEEHVLFLLSIIFDFMKKDGINVKPLLNVEYYPRVDKEKKVAGLIIKLPNPSFEPECNYVATAFFDMEPKYFESELYASGKFGLCGRDDKGGHLNYGFIIDTIETVDDMWNAIVSLKGDIKA